MEITLEVEEGRQFTLRRLEFIGNTNTRDVVMRREVVINEGDAYNKRLWDLSMLRLNQLGLFDEIKEKDAITRTNDRDQTVDIDLQVKERGRQQIQLNGGVSGYAGSFFGLEYSTNNLLGYGESLSVALSGGNRSKSVSFGFTEPYLMGKPVSLGFTLFASKYQFLGDSFDPQLASQAGIYASFFFRGIDGDALHAAYGRRLRQPFGAVVTVHQEIRENLPINAPRPVVLVDGQQQLKTRMSTATKIRITTGQSSTRNRHRHQPRHSLDLLQHEERLPRPD